MLRRRRVEDPDHPPDFHCPGFPLSKEFGSMHNTKITSVPSLRESFWWSVLSNRRSLALLDSHLRSPFAAHGRRFA